MDLEEHEWEIIERIIRDHCWADGKRNRRRKDDRRMAKRTRRQQKPVLKHNSCRKNDRRIVDGILFMRSNGLVWRQVPPRYGHPKTLYRRFLEWHKNGTLNKIRQELLSILRRRIDHPIPEWLESQTAFVVVKKWQVRASKIQRILGAI